MGKQFDTISIALIPIALVVGIAVGIQFSTGIFPADIVQQAVVAIIGIWVGFLVVWFVLDLIAGSLLDQLESMSMNEEPNAGKPGELTILAVRDGEVVGELRSWDKPMPQPRRAWWSKKLPKLILRGRKSLTSEPPDAH
jgi:xanthosine utilization system XapX-like protein